MTITAHLFSDESRRVALRYLSAGIMLASFILFMISIPARAGELRRLADAARPLLEQYTQLEPGMIQAALAMFPPGALMIEMVVMGLYLLNGLLVSWLRPNDWLALLTAAGLSAFALHITPTLNQWMTVHPDLAYIGIVMKSIGLGLAFLFLYLFPGGYFAPSWMPLFTVAWIVWAAAWLMYPESSYAFRDPYSISGAGFIALMVWWGIGVFSQVYRYRFVSSRVERQQSKYVFYGATFVFLGYCVYVPLRDMMAFTTRPELSQALFQMVAPYIYLLMVGLIPITIAFSILRYRLFDIDIIIRRTLLYGALTALLVTVYFGSVVLLQTLFASVGGGQSRTAVVLSTLGIAALFNPLRRKLQEGIDRRFFRSKYDSEIALARFGERVRNEVDLERLCAHLANVVNETIQPAEVSIWLGGTGSADGPDRSRTVQSMENPQ